MKLPRWKLEANGIVVEPAARQACPPDRIFDPLLSRAALIVERNHPRRMLNPTRGYNSPADLGDDAAGLPA